MINAQLQYHLGIPDPDALSDSEWATAFEILQFIRDKERNSSMDDFSNLFGGKKK